MLFCAILPLNKNYYFNGAFDYGRPLVIAETNTCRANNHPFLINLDKLTLEAEK
jgi:hypothetical protein